MLKFKSANKTIFFDILFVLMIFFQLPESVGATGSLEEEPQPEITYVPHALAFKQAYRVQVRLVPNVLSLSQGHC